MNITLLLQPPAMLYFYFTFKYSYRTLFINPLSSFIILERIVQTVCWFSLNNSETVKAATLAFCSIQLHLIRDVLCQIWYSLLAPVSRYWAKLRRWYFRFPDSWSIPYKKKLS